LADDCRIDVVVGARGDYIRGPSNGGMVDSPLRGMRATANPSVMKVMAIVLSVH